MNCITAKVSEIQESDKLHLVKFDSNGYTLSMVCLELNRDIEVETAVKLSISPSHIAIAKDFTTKVSYSNRLNATILSIENGKLLTTIKLKFFDTVLESIITAESSKRLDLKVKDKVTALIKATELSILEVVDA